MKTLKLFIEGKCDNVNPNPLKIKSSMDFWVMGCINQGVRMYDEDYRLQNRLLSQFYRVGTNKLILKLKDVNWFDGTWVTANDVKRSIEEYSKSSEDFEYDFLKNVVGFEEFIQGKSDISGLRTIDRRTLEVYFKHYDRYFDNMLLQPLIPPELNQWLGCGSYEYQGKKEKRLEFEDNKKFHF